MSRLFSWCSLFALLAAACPLTACAALIALTAADLKNPEPDWPKFRGPKGDGISGDTGLLKKWPKDGPPLLWQSEPVGIGFSSVSMAGTRIFTMGDDKGSSWVFGLDRNTGKKHWSAKVGKAGGSYSGTRGTPTVYGELVYALGQFGDLVCLEAATGTEKWRKSFAKDFDGRHGSWQYTESPLVDGDKLVCTPGGQKKGAMVALDKKTGSVIWESDFGETAGYASVVITEAGGLRQYVQLLSGGVASVAAQDGRLLWRYHMTGKDSKKLYFAGNTANIPNAVVLGDYILAGAGYGPGGAGLMKLSAGGSGVKEEEVYFKREMKSRHGGYVVVGDYVYADTDNSGHPFCAEWKTGKIRWTRKDEGGGKGSVAVVYADGRLYMRYENGYVALVEASPEAYKEISAFKIPNSGTSQSWSHPVVVGGKLYLREKDILWCYDVKAK
jgi:outer membrane protein assembly factor BamB